MLNEKLPSRPILPAFMENAGPRMPNIKHAKGRTILLFNSIDHNMCRKIYLFDGPD